MDSLNIRSLHQQAIELYGIHGEFNIPSSDYIVKYFSTYANNRKKGEGAHQLLKELKPMRERVEPDKINNLNSILQRDLNDARVANELVPYLLGMKGNLAFFPAILGVLLPNNFFYDSDKKYPQKTKIDNTFSYKLEEINYWDIELPNQNPLGILKIYPHNTDIIVLDGQHRANAFRVITGDFFEDKKSQLYEPFYHSVAEELEGKSFNADLPVTIIWFEPTVKDNDTLDPSLISRKLFVDVNNTAKPVSESRTILLNDYEPSSLLTQFFYSLIAEETNFNPGVFSLLNSGLDIDSDLRYSHPHSFTLTTPQIIHYSMDWFFFGTRHHINNKESYKVKRETPKTDTSICKYLFPEIGQYIHISGEDENSKYINITSYDMDNIFNLYKKELGCSINHIYNNFNLLTVHYEAENRLFQSRDSWGSTTKKETLDKVFCGGEGLYYSYKNIPQHKRSKSANDIISAINEIENEFKSYRKEILHSEYKSEAETSRINEAYESFRTKAFQVALLMSFYNYYEDKTQDYESIYECSKSFVKKLNSISPSGWINILTLMRPKIIKSTDPKQWPAYHKIILKAIQDENEYFNVEDNIYKSPEVLIFENEIQQKINSWCEANNYLLKELEYSQIDQTLKDGWYTIIHENIEKLFSDCELTIHGEIDFSQVGDKYLMENLLSDDEDIDL